MAGTDWSKVFILKNGMTSKSKMFMKLKLITFVNEFFVEGSKEKDYLRHTSTDFLLAGCNLQGACRRHPLQAPRKRNFISCASYLASRPLIHKLLIISYFELMFKNFQTLSERLNLIFSKIIWKLKIFFFRLRKRLFYDPACKF